MIVLARCAAVMALAGAACLAAALLVGVGGSSDTYRVDALFDNAANLIPGQDVKIAGARVGRVAGVKLTAERKARVQMEVEEGFAPFRADAECTIRPQSLIGEKFIQCTPGTPGAGELGKGRTVPTVPVARTHSPVDLDLVFGALRRPYRERLTIIVNELGTGLAGRPAELNEAIRRAAPALQETNQVLGILDRDRARLGRLVDRSDRVLGELAGRRRQVESFVERAGESSSAVAGRRDELGRTVDRLPRLLAELEPSARSLTALARDATPAVRDLRAAAPGLRTLAADVGPFTDAARPALRKLSEVARTGRATVRSALPVARRLRPVTERLRPVLRLAAEVNESLRATGAVEGLQTFVYFASAATARFDRFSHILPSYQVASSCQQYSTQPVEGCSARFAGASGPPSEGSSGPAPTRRRAAEGRGRLRERRSRANRPGPHTVPRRRGAPDPASPGSGPPASPAPGTPDVTPDALLDFLLR